MVCARRHHHHSDQEFRMSRLGARDPLPQLAAMARAVANPAQPAEILAALERATAECLGHKLFTVMLYHGETGESERFYTNRPDAYPVGGRKALNPTFCTEQVLRRREPFLGRTGADIKAVFFDHERIAALGCHSVINLPVAEDGQILGTINLLHEESWYEADDLVLGAVFAALMVPVYRRLTAR
jgi:transcriptional regulator with GAF, ATPase, and Fis domain